MNALAEVPHFVMGEGKEHSESDKELCVDWMKSEVTGKVSELF